MLKLTAVILILVNTVATYNDRFHHHRGDYDHHCPYEHNYPHNHHWPHHEHHHEYHQSYDRGSPEFFDDDHNAHEYFEGQYYNLPNRNSWNGNGWSTNRRMRPSSSSPSSVQNPQSDFRIQCLSSCPATLQYNPVCGTNYLWYENIAKLQCAKSCGVDVSLMSRSKCPSPPQQNEPTASLTRTTTGVPPELSIDERIKELE